MKIIYETFDGRQFDDEYDARKWEDENCGYKVFNEDGREVGKDLNSISNHGFIIVADTYEAVDFLENEVEVAICNEGYGVYLWNGSNDQFELITNRVLQSLCILNNRGFFDKVFAK